MDDVRSSDLGADGNALRQPVVVTCVIVVGRKVGCYKGGMTRIPEPTARLSDDQLLASVTALVCAERHATAALIRALAELDRRKLFLGLGYASLFVYCTQV